MTGVGAREPAIMGVLLAVTAKLSSQKPEDGLAIGGLAFASPARYVEIGTELLEIVLARFLAGGDCGFERNELKAAAWIRLSELSLKAAARPRTRHILALELKKAIMKFVRPNREHAKSCAGLFLKDAEGKRSFQDYIGGRIDEDENSKPAKLKIARFTHHHCVPYSFEERLRYRDTTFSGLKAWNFTHLNSECEARKVGGRELIREELKLMIDSLPIVPFKVSEVAAPGRRACYRAA